jgi:hypothetical protein
MARQSLSESLELLLDTMCNTFGGVMFIAISMVITLMICQQQLTPEKQLEEERKRLETCKKENASLNERLAREEHRLAELEKLARENVDEKDSGLATAVAELEQEIKKINRECDTLNSELKIADGQIRRLEHDNSRREKEISEKQLELKKQEAALKEENRRLVQELAILRGTLADIPVKRIDFARNQKTTHSPYFVIVKDGRLYPAGNLRVGWQRKYISVHREGNVLHLTPQHGMPLASVDPKNPLAEFSGFVKDSHFLWVLVSNESLAAFVKLRRMLRSSGCLVRWDIDTRYLVYLVSNPSYSAAN